MKFRRSAFDRAAGRSSSEVIKWAKEVCNTSPEMLQLSVHDDDSGAVLVKQCGMYELQFVFFVPVDAVTPSVQVRLDNQPVLSTINERQHLVFHRETDRQMSYTCYLNIEEGMKVSLSLSNMEKPERKLSMNSRNVNSASQATRKSQSRSRQMALSQNCSSCSRSMLVRNDLSRDVS
jgi:hypothetical protein